MLGGPALLALPSSSAEIIATIAWDLPVPGGPCRCQLQYSAFQYSVSTCFAECWFGILTCGDERQPVSNLSTVTKKAEVDAPARV